MHRDEKSEMSFFCTVNTTVYYVYSLSITGRIFFLDADFSASF